MTDEPLQIAPAGRSEAAEVIELIHRVFDEYGFSWEPQEEFWDLLADDFPYTEPRGALWVARRPARPRVVGSVAAELLAGGTVELHRLYLDTKLRGLGHGRRLILHALNWAKARGCHHCLLWSDTNFTDAHRLYERLGFRQTAARTLNDANQSIEYCFERALADDSTAPAN